MHLPHLLHPLIVGAAAYLAAAAALPSALLYSLHTYVHPDSPSPSATRAALRPPSAAALRRRPSTPSDDAAAQIFRLRLSDSLLRSRPFFPLYNLAALLSLLALAELFLANLLPRPFPPDLTTLVLALAAAALLLLGLATAALESSASRRTEKQLGLVAGALGFLLSISLLFGLAPSVVDFKIGSLDGVSKVSIGLIAGCVTGILLMPAGKMARAFWIGTDQLRWSLPVIACGGFTRFLFYANFVVLMFASMLWINPVVGDGNVGMLRSDFVKFRSWCLLLWAVSQLLLLRPCLQMWLNEAVLCWYQRLHSSKAPDLEYSRAKMFLHNHYLCLSALQFLAPPVLVLLFIGLAEVRGGFPGVCSSDACSSAVKEVVAFLAWWIVFVWVVLTSAGLAMHRIGLLYVS